MQQQTYLLTYQNEIYTSKNDNIYMILYCRDINKKNVILILDDIKLTIGINMTKAQQVIDIKMESIRQLIDYDIQRLGQFDSYKYMNLFHEYSEQPNQYAIVNFYNPNTYKQYIQKFNNNITKVNCSNSYMCNDENLASLNIKLCRENDISLASWNCISNYEYKEEDDIAIYKTSINNCKCVDQSGKLQYNIDKTNINNTNNVNDNQQYSDDILIAYWDIETYADNNVKTINMDINIDQSKQNITDNAIPFIISIVLQWSSQKEPFKCFGISSVNISEYNIQKDYELIVVKNEQQLLLQFIKIMGQYKPDIITGFNDNAFDWIVIINRLTHYKLLQVFYDNLSLQQQWQEYFGMTYNSFYHVQQRFKQLDKVKIENNTEIIYNKMNIKGTICVDTMLLLRKLYPTDDKYSLDHFLQKMGLPLKHDISYSELEQYRLDSNIDPTNELNMQNMRKAVDYCINDSVSCLKLWNMRKIIQENRTLAELSYCDLDNCFFRAGGKKVRNLLIGFTRRYMNMAISNTRYVHSTSSYDGAYVFPVIPCLNREHPISTLDYNSLYPSVAMTFNICPDKVISSDNILFKEIDQQYNDINNVNNTYQCKYLQTQIQVGQQQLTGYILKHNNDQKLMGTYTVILDQLALKRKEIRVQMSLLQKQYDQQNDDKIQVQIDILECQQKAIKVMMNTFYGEAGNRISSIYNVLVAGTITKKSQEMLFEMQQFVEDRQCKIHYGDTDSNFISIPIEMLNKIEQDYPIINNDCIQRKKQWEVKIQETIQYSIQLAKDFNEHIHKVTGSNYLNIVYEKTLFPMIFFAKKAYSGIKHEYKPDLDSKPFVQGMTIKKRGNAPLLKDVGENILKQILSYNNNESIYDVIKYQLNEIIDFNNVESFVITETFRQQSRNIKIQNFNKKLQQQGIILQNLSKFQYLFVQTEEHNPITGKKNKLSKSDYMLLKQTFDNNRDMYQIDVLQYITGSIKGLLQSFLKLQYEDKQAKSLYKEIIQQYKGDNKVQDDNNKLQRKQYNTYNKNLIQQLTYNDDIHFDCNKSIYSLSSIQSVKQFNGIKVEQYVERIIKYISDCSQQQQQLSQYMDVMQNILLQNDLFEYVIKTKKQIKLTFDDVKQKLQQFCMSKELQFEQFIKNNYSNDYIVMSQKINNVQSYVYMMVQYLKKLYFEYMCYITIMQDKLQLQLQSICFRSIVQ